MASTERLKMDKYGKIFVPMSVVGGEWDTGFINSKKMSILAVLAVVDTVFIMSGTDGTVGKMIMRVLVSLIATIQAIRYGVLEEKYYYARYTDSKKYDKTTPNIFWRIAAMNDTDEGCILTYADMKTAIVVKMIKASIVGKDSDEREEHIDGISEMIKELNMMKYSFVHINRMERADKNAEMADLDKMIARETNKNLSKILGMQVTYLKNLAMNTLVESDYYLIHTTKSGAATTIISNVSDAVYKAVGVSYKAFSVLSSDEITELSKDINGVDYFDNIKAVTGAMLGNKESIGEAGEIVGVLLDDNKLIKIGKRERNIILQFTSSLKVGEFTVNGKTLIDTILCDNNKNNKNS